MSDVISIEEGEQIVPPLSLEQEIALTESEYLALITGWVEEWTVTEARAQEELDLPF
jgi:hypothetical protein